MEVTSCTPTTADIVLHNDTNNVIGFGAPYTIQAKRSDRWYILAYRENNIAWIEVSYELESWKTWRNSLDWTAMYGALPDGNYRIVKKGDTGYASAEFTLISQSKEGLS